MSQQSDADARADLHRRVKEATPAPAPEQQAPEPQPSKLPLAVEAYRAKPKTPIGFARGLIGVPKR